MEFDKLPTGLCYREDRADGKTVHGEGRHEKPQKSTIINQNPVRSTQQRLGSDWYASTTFLRCLVYKFIYSINYAIRKGGFIMRTPADMRQTSHGKDKNKAFSRNARKTRGFI